MQEDGVGVKHAADPRGLGEDKRNDKAHKKGGQKTSGRGCGGERE